MNAATKKQIVEAVLASSSMPSLRKALSGSMIGKAMTAREAAIANARMKGTMIDRADGTARLLLNDRTVWEFCDGLWICIDRNE